MTIYNYENKKKSKAIENALFKYFGCNSIRKIDNDLWNVYYSHSIAETTDVIQITEENITLKDSNFLFKIVSKEGNCFAHEIFI